MRTRAADDPQAGPDGALTRRGLLLGAIGAVSTMLAGRGSAWGQTALPASSPPPVVPRASWGADRPPTGPLEREAPGDVRFLLVHHSVTGNDYRADDVPGLLQGIYAHHTTARGWPDIAYNFFVDRFGTVWEGRQGSLTGPVKGSATGGSQGFALLCCFLGEHSAAAPSPAATDGMVALLAWLADVYGIDTAPGAATSFVSRGSNRWPAGTPVRAPTICGHRDMSVTACPGDAAYALVRDRLPAAVTARRLAPQGPGPAPAPDPPPPPAAVAAPAAPPVSATVPAPTSPATPPPLSADHATSEPAAVPPSPAGRGASGRAGDDVGAPLPVAVGGLIAAVTATVGVAAWRQAAVRARRGGSAAKRL